MANAFLQPAQERSILQRIGTGLLAFGEGAAGRGRQFLEGQEQQRQTLSKERKQAAAEDLRRARGLLDIGDLQGVRNLAQERIGMIQQLGGDPSDTAAILQLVDAAIGGDKNAFDALNAQVDAGLQSAADRGIIKLPATGGATQRQFESLIADLSEAEQDEARKIKLGLSPKARRGIPTLKTLQDGTTVLFDPNATTGEEMFQQLNTVEDIAEAKRRIKGAEKFGERQAALSVSKIEAGFNSIQAIDKNIRTLDKAVRAIDEGASTGVIQKLLPSIRSASIKLDQIKNDLGLDVVGAVTFGALSAGELNLALDTALPTGLEPPELRIWLLAKKEAQNKLRNYFSKQVQFLDVGGTVAGFLKSEDERNISQTAAPTPGQKVIQFDAQGNRING